MKREGIGHSNLPMIMLLIELVYNILNGKCSSCYRYLLPCIETKQVLFTKCEGNCPQWENMDYYLNIKGKRKYVNNICQVIKNSTFLKIVYIQHLVRKYLFFVCCIFIIQI